MTKPRKNAAAAALGRLGAKATNSALTAKERAASARHAALARWRTKGRKKARP